ncbi:MAG: S1 RNA-binding domain-containing protein [Actinobacteria bacterium]|nr:S1 RNA-binding domain-containing protein [Actinomycetota bacterium]
MCLWLGGDEHGFISVQLFADAAYGVHHDAKSHSGIAVTLGRGAVLAHSGKQRLVVKSSTEAELVTQSDSVSYGFRIINFVKAQGKVYNPPDGTEVVGEVSLKNKMGCYVVVDNAVRIMVPRDLHIGNDVFDGISVGDRIRVQIKKSQVRVNATHILSIGELVGVEASAAPAAVPAAEEQEQLVEEASEEASEDASEDEMPALKEPEE